MHRSLFAIVCVPASLAAQAVTLTASDSALIGRVLLAEDRRDSTDPVLVQAEQHGDGQVRLLARRARSRIRDPQFTARDSLPPLPIPTRWPEPGWRLRYRELASQRDNCAGLRAALSDLDWRIRLRAADLLTSTCSGDDTIVTTLRGWIDDLPRITRSRAAGDVSWHAAAHALVALSRVRPTEAAPRIAQLARHGQWHVRMYAARAAAILSDTTLLRTLARDRDDNVKEAAIDALSRLTSHASDDVYLAALQSNGPQAVRAAAIALKGSPRADVRTAASRAFQRWARRDNDSERDVRVALLEAAGRSASEDRRPVRQLELPARTVALALGDDVRLRVRMARSSGGGTFVVRLRGDAAPIMAARVLALARAGYYNNGTWHRVEPDFVIQGGAHGDNEYVGHRRYFRDELSAVPHVRGTVGMSTRGHDTGDAQWFINLKDNLRLGRDYTVFAEVVEGIGIVDEILEGDVIATVTEIRERP